MRTVKVICFFFAILWIPANSYARANYYLEADPIAFLLQGYSLHGGIEYSMFRLQLGVFAAKLPADLRDNKHFTVEQNGLGLKYDYFGNEPTGGFLGLEYGYTKLTYKHSASGDKERRQANLAGIRVGYKYIIKQQFYVTPWLAIKRNISGARTVKLSGDEYHESEWILFPTIHVGVQF